MKHVDDSTLEFFGEECIFLVGNFSLSVEFLAYSQKCISLSHNHSYPMTS
ncbi:hypothetical protein Sjap_022899 [Stephania japonica]|uniref:Uncharacterized protein n=1 Tax=Stephania japonica TaxID=461633 RepID=A0AAP0ESS8_9MAGN